MSMLDNSSTQDIDALLAQADSLMNEMASKMGDKPAEEVETPGAGDAVDQELSGSTDGFSDANSAVDPEAVADGLTAEALDPPQSVPLNPRNHGDGPGPTPAPSDWVEEASASPDHMADQPVPLIEEASDDDSAAAILPSAAVQKTRRVVTAVFHAPIDLLVLIDRPFARLGPTVKTCIGYAAVATLVIAAGTWIAGSVYLLQ